MKFKEIDRPIEDLSLREVNRAPSSGRAPSLRTRCRCHDARVDAMHPTRPGTGIEPAGLRASRCLIQNLARIAQVRPIERAESQGWAWPACRRKPHRRLFRRPDERAPTPYGRHLERQPYELVRRTSTARILMLGIGHGIEHFPIAVCDGHANIRELATGMTGGGSGSIEAWPEIRAHATRHGRAATADADQLSCEH